MIEHIFHKAEPSAKPFSACLPVLAFLLVLTLSATVLNRCFPRDPYFANYPLWDSKFRYLEQWPQVPDVLLVGDSHVYRHANPQHLAIAMGKDPSSFSIINLGVSDLTLVELDLLLDRLKVKRERGESLPKWVVIDPFLTPGRVEWMSNWATTRAIRSHNLDNSLHLLAFEWRYLDTHVDTHADAWSFLEAIYRCTSHLLSLAAHFFNVGVLTPQGFPRQGDFMEVTETIPDMVLDSGFVALDQEVDPAVPQRRLLNFPAHRPYAGQAVYNPAYLDFFAHVRKRILELGAVPVFIATPILDEERVAGQQRAIADYLRKDPEAIFLDYSELLTSNDYRNLRYWHDRGHLTLEGADIFSHRLGEDLARIGDKK